MNQSFNNEEAHWIVDAEVIFLVNFNYKKACILVYEHLANRKIGYAAGLEANKRQEGQQLFLPTRID